MTEALAIAGAFARQQGAQHQAEADQEDQELKGGEDALHQRPGRGIAALPLGIRVKPRPDFVLAAEHLHLCSPGPAALPFGDGVKDCSPVRRLVPIKKSVNTC